MNAHEHQDAELERASFDRYRNDEEWRTRGFRDDRSSAFAESSEFGRTVLKQLFLLNGSGLIAIAPILQLGGVNIATNKNLYLALGLSLVAGLVLAVLASLLGFFSLTKYGDASAEMITNQVLLAEHSALMRNGNNESAQSTKGRELKAKERADKDYKDANWYRNASVLVGILSLVFFLMGVFVSLRLISG